MCFISDVHCYLIERPCTDCRVYCFITGNLISDTCQIFYRDTGLCAFGFSDDLFADTVVCIIPESAFFSTELFEMFFCIPCTNGLKIRLTTGVSLSGFSTFLPGQLFERIRRIGYGHRNKGFFEVQLYRRLCFSRQSLKYRYMLHSNAPLYGVVSTKMNTGYENNEQIVCQGYLLIKPFRPFKQWIKKDSRSKV